jgi:hypothetical protein
MASRPRQRRQHEVGRTVTANIVKLCDGTDGKKLAELLRVFNRMYRPHAVREDTVLFPAFRSVHAPMRPVSVDGTRRGRA